MIYMISDLWLDEGIIHPTQPKLLHPLTAKLTVLLTDGYQYVDRSWRPQSFCYVCCPAMIFDHIVTALKARRWSHEIRVGPYIIYSHLNHLRRLKSSVTPSKGGVVVCLPDNFFFQQLECLVTFSIKKRDIDIEDTRKAGSQIFLSSRRSSRCPRHALRHVLASKNLCVCQFWRDVELGCGTELYRRYVAGMSVTGIAGSWRLM
jgi:hypothetical protein